MWDERTTWFGMDGLMAVKGGWDGMGYNTKVLDF
jgi:hypothetical protein